MHGLALNVNSDLSHFEMIVPCGIADKGVTSLSAELDRTVQVRDVIEPMAQHLAQLYDAEIEWQDGLPNGISS